MVLKPGYGPLRASGSRKQFDSRPKKQFLIADGRTIYGFSKRVKGQGFPTCASFVDKTCDIKCQKIKGFEAISLSNSASLTADPTVPYFGKACEWIDLNKLSKNVGCGNGDKMVIKNSRGVSRKQFLFLDGKTILAFPPYKQKLTACSAFTEVTFLVKCKPLPDAGADSISLPTCVPRTTTSTTTTIESDSTTTPFSTTSSSTTTTTGMTSTTSTINASTTTTTTTSTTKSDSTTTTPPTTTFSTTSSSTTTTTGNTSTTSTTSTTTTTTNTTSSTTSTTTTTTP